MSKKIAEFALTYPMFLISLVLSCIFLVATVVLAIGGLSERWERRFAKALIVTAVPVLIWIIFYFYPVFNPVYVTFLGWFCILGFLGLRKANENVNELKYLEKTSSWRCPKCKTINELVYIVCKECNEPQPGKNQQS